MRSPLAISIWFITCVGIGLFMAWVDGIGSEAVLEAALVTGGVGLILAAVAWAVSAAGKL